MEADTRCVMCSRHIEDGGHLFFNCKAVKQLWSYLALEEHCSLLSEMHSAKDTITYILKLEEGTQLGIVLLLWLWWQERNAVCEGERRRLSNDLAYVVQRMKEEFLELHKPKERNLDTRVKGWSRPSGDWVKINSDGSFLPSIGAGGWGFVIRDDSAQVITAGAGNLKHIRDALQAEVAASTQGIKAALEKGMTKVILETDSLILKQALTSDQYRFAEIGGMVLELKTLITGGLNNFICNYVPRTCNKVAHALAAKGSMLPQGDGSRWEGMPPCVAVLVASDAAEPLS
jgi:hypothetical protein